MKKSLLTLFAALLTATTFASGHVATATGTHVTCNGMCNGTATAMAAGGVGPYGYTWTGPSGYTATGQNITGLCAGTYVVTAIDSADMSTALYTLIINQPTALNAVTPGTTQTCLGSCISLNATCFGGTPPYTFNWSPAIGLSCTTCLTPIACPTSTTTYMVAVTDGNGCMASAPLVVLVNSPITVTTTPTLPTCGMCNGAITASPSGGSAPYTYSWTGPGGPYTTQNVSGLCAGTYTLVVTDASGCTDVSTVALSSASSVNIVLDTVVNINCGGASAGSITVHGTGGTAPYTYLWNTGATTPSISGLAAGAYYVTVTDNSGCTAIQTYLINNAGTLFLCVYSSPANCSNNGTAFSIPVGGVPPYSYLWSNGATTQNATGLGSGTYTLTVTDASGCSTVGTVYVWSNCYNIIKGKVYADDNGNCVQNTGENGISGLSVSTTSGSYGYTNVSGDYMIYTSAMSTNVTHVNPLYSNVICPAGNTQAVNFATLGDTVTVDFADQYIVGINDLQITYFPGVARPGFVQNGWINYKNAGTTTISGVTISLTHDSILTYNSSSPASSSYSYPTIGWNIGTLNPGQQGTISTAFTVPLITAGGYIGRILHYTAQINPVAGDQTPANNSVSPTAIITASYDPNMKEVMPAGNITAADSILHYTIHFQNTGTDTAFTVVLKDTLSQFLDITTVEPGVASHPYTFNVAYTGELTWTFNNIYLVDSATNEPASHGFATFTVKQKANNPIGTHIDNTASIYFDFNPAVVTNTVSNMVIDPSAIAEFASANSNIKVYPNPFSDATTFVIHSDKTNETYTFELFDVLGKKVMEQTNITAKQFSINRNSLENGMYFYKIYTAESVVGVGKVIVK